MTDFAERVEERESQTRPRRKGGGTGGGVRFTAFTRLMAIALVIAIPALAYALQKPGTEGSQGGLILESGTTVWFCVAGSTDRSTSELIDVANPSGSAAIGRYTWFVGDQRLDPNQVSIPPAGRLELDASKDLAGKVAGAPAAAVIELDVTSAAVAQTIAVNSKEATGTMSAPCTSGTSGSRYFAGGSSVRGASTYLIVSNPFPQDAVVDVDVYTDTGIERPNNLQRLPLFAGKTTMLKVSDEVRRRSALGTLVRAESGQVVSAQMVNSNGDRIPAGVSLSGGVTTPSTEWWFADGAQLSDVAQTYSVMNPSEKEALIEVSYLPEGLPADPGRTQSATIAPRSESTVTIDPGFTPGTLFSAVVRSTNGTEVVVDRMIGSTSPTSHGMSFGPGVQAPGERFVLPNAWGGGPATPYSTSLVVANPANATAHVTVGRLTDGTLAVPSSLQEVAIPGGQRVSLDVSSAFPGIRGMSLAASSDLPVVIEARTVAIPPKTGYEVVPLGSLPSSFVFPPQALFTPPAPTQLPDATPSAAPAETSASASPR